MGWRGNEAIAHLIPELTLDSGEWTVSSSGFFIFPSTHCIGDWMCSRLGVDSLEKR